MFRFFKLRKWFVWSWLGSFIILSSLWGIPQTILGVVGLEGLVQPWLGLKGSALITVSLISIWQFVGIPMLLFYAALVSIPEEILDAAKVDGSSGLNTFWKIKSIILCS